MINKGSTRVKPRIGLSGYFAFICGALFLSLLSWQPVVPIASSRSAEVVRNGVPTSDAESSESPTVARIYVPLRSGSRLNLQSPSTTFIDFDHDASGNPLFASCLFVDTSPLTEIYAPLGVHFSGPDPTSGGAILHNCSNFGVPPVSGPNFLAFNRRASFTSGGRATDPETITFDSPALFVSLIASAGRASGTFQLQGFDANNMVVSTDVQISPGSSYVQLQVSSPTGIKKVVLSRLDMNPDGEVIAILIEDLSFSLLFDRCLQDESNGNNFQFSSTTGEYQFTTCSGLTIGGVGAVIKKGGIITLQHNGLDRRVLVRLDTTQNKGTVSVKIFGSETTFTITDLNTASGTCGCS